MSEYLKVPLPLCLDCCIGISLYVSKGKYKPGRSIYAILEMIRDSAKAEGIGMDSDRVGVETTSSLVERG